MPWLPDFTGAAELARLQTRETARADPAAEYLAALNSGEAYNLKLAWPGRVVVFDPLAGEVRGDHRLRRFIASSHALFASRDARIETVASTRSHGRAVLELLVHLNTETGEGIAWPVAVVAESLDDLSVVFRTYCSQQPVAGRRPVRPAILPPRDEHPGDVVARYQEASGRGDAESIVQTFASDGYYQEPIGPHSVHRGAADLRSFFTERLGAGGIGVELCAVTDDGVRCGLEFNCVRWGERTLPSQAGLAVYERGPDGLLSAVRVYDDVVPPAA